MMTTRLYLLQRATALLMAPLVLGHLLVMVYAVRGGITSREILDRTQDSLFWGLFYGLFVVAVSIHAAIGLRTIMHEHLGLKGAILNSLAIAAAAMLLGMGMKAVLAVTG